MDLQQVAIFAPPDDSAANVVAAELDSRGVPVFRCDPTELPSASVAAVFDTSWAGYVATAGHRLNLATVRGAWWRHRLPPTALDNEGAGLVALLGTLRWLNHPDAIIAADPVRQLAAAAYAGLPTPTTLLTNDPAHLRAFVATHPITTNGLDHPGDQTAEPALVRLLCRPPSTAFRLRTVAVGRRMFTAHLDSEGEPTSNGDATTPRHTPADLPTPVRNRIVALLTRLRLRLAVVDLAVTADGNYQYLHADPHGDWLSMQHNTGQPVAAAIADALTGPR